jgi:hypothetical protein
MSEAPAAAKVWGQALVIFEELGHADAARVRAALDALEAA